MKRTFSIWLAVLASIPMNGQLAASQPPAPTATQPAAMVSPQQPVARVNGSVLTQADLLREEMAIFPYARQHNGGIPKEMEPQIRNGAMKMIIFEELVYQETLRRKITIPAAKLQKAEADFRRQFGAPDQYRAYVTHEFHGSQALLREKIRRSLLIEAFLNSEVERKATVSPAEAKAYYEKNPARFQLPETFTFQTISILPPPKATPEQMKEGRKRADDALRQAKATKTIEEFGLLAEKISDDDYRVMMGEHKPMQRDKLAPQVVNALLAMKSGDVSDVIQVEQAYTILRLKEHTPAGKVKFDEVKAQLQKEMRQSKENQLRAALDKKLRLNAKVEEL